MWQVNGWDRSANEVEDNVRTSLMTLDRKMSRGHYVACN